MIGDVHGEPIMARQLADQGSDNLGPSAFFIRIPPPPKRWDGLVLARVDGGISGSN